MKTNKELLVEAIANLSDEQKALIYPPTRSISSKIKSWS